MVNEALPLELQDHSRVMDKDAADSVLASIATNSPELYKEISHKLMQLGRHASFEEGSTLRLSDLASPVSGRKAVFDFVRAKEDEIDDSDMSQSDKNEAKAALFTTAADDISNDTYKYGLASGNPFALQVKAKARGNKGQLSSLLSTPGTYANHKGEMVPVFIKRSYAEGLSPEEYWSAAHGGRVGVLCLDPNTEVRKPDGTAVALKDIRVGDSIMAVDSNGGVHPSTVKRVYDNGVQPVYEYVFRKLASREFVSVRATKEHKLLARVWRNKKRPAKGRELGPMGLTPLSKISVCKNHDNNAYVASLPTGVADASYGYDFPLALLTGMLVGDGCTTASMEGSVEFSCADPVLIEDTREYIAGFGLELHKTASANFTWTLRMREGVELDWVKAADGRRICNKARCTIWDMYGGKYAHQKEVPSDIWGWSQKSCADFIAGYTATDGCVCTPKSGRGWVSYGSTSLKLLEGVRDILAIRFGIWANPIAPPVTKGRVSPLYTISITHNESLRRFKSSIPLVGIKRYRLAAMDVDQVTNRSSASGCRANSCTYVGDMRTMDIEVEHPDHMFLLANGLISSNSTKTGTAKGGYLGKLLSAASMEAIITGADCETEHGIPVKPDDPDNIGAVLARKAGPFSAGTVLTKQVIADLNKRGVDEIVLRSAITCGLGKGICQQCAGKREQGGFPPIGYHLGAVAASAMAEQVAQQALNCWAMGTEVLMGDWSVKRIENIIVGDYVMGSDVLGSIKPTKVTAVFNNGLRECYLTTFVKNGCNHDSEPITVATTLDHKFRATRRVSGQLDAVNNFKPRILPIGTKSKYFYALPPSTYTGGGVYEPMSLLIGSLLGDGCYTEAVNGVHISCADASQIDDLGKDIAGLGVRIVKLAGHDYYYRLSGDASRNVVKEWLKTNGCYGKYAHEKAIPSVVDTWDNVSVSRLISGLFVTDGSVYLSDSNKKPGLALASTSVPLLEGVRRLLLLRFGILTSAITKTNKVGVSVRANEFGNKYVRMHDGYQFTITSYPAVIKFMEVIPLFGVKRQRLAGLLAGYTPKTSASATPNFGAFKRIAQERIGVLNTFDIEVDNEDHLFVLANGICGSNSKHSGKKHKGEGFSGFEVIKNLATSPETYPDRSAIATLDGIVDKIEPAPQGGTNIYIGGEVHHALPDMEVMVKPGDTVEAGDILSDGVANPSDIVKYKGLGEGRRYFADRFTKAFRDSGLGINRRNAEAVSSALVNHVSIDDDDSEGDGLVGDTVRYSDWSRTYKPRPDSIDTPVQKAVGQYMDSPYLHYSIGTKITPSVAKRLTKHGYTSTLVNKRPASVTPVFKSVVKTPEFMDDWMARLGSSYLETRLIKDVQLGAESDTHGLNPIPGLAKTTEFGSPPPGSISPY